jgi:hypothetical protein
MDSVFIVGGLILGFVVMKLVIKLIEWMEKKSE